VRFPARRDALELLHLVLDAQRVPHPDGRRAGVRDVRARVVVRAVVRRALGAAGGRQGEGHGQGHAQPAGHRASGYALAKTEQLGPSRASFQVQRTLLRSKCSVPPFPARPASGCAGACEYSPYTGNFWFSDVFSHDHILFQMAIISSKIVAYTSILNLV
jgi:hypothetical protein